MSSVRTYPSNVSNSSNTSKYIELQLQHDRLFKQLSYGHINYDIDDLNEMRQTIYINQMLKHNIRINHIMSLERSRYKMCPIQSSATSMFDQDSVRNTNLLSANSKLNSDKIEYVTKYRLVDCKLVKNQVTSSIKKPSSSSLSIKERLKQLLEKKPNETNSCTSSQVEPSSELKHAHREFLRHELQRMRTSIP
ncbi:predicted protein [Candida tropicalis MYA-3404]|uniref:Uncharacterized protein n=1 Tax=Candida tropicalis (strain ATCC MYA-3404 / T1) TaxID=294747 RepID=C5MIP6_CANTT|nr:predicted protein [Candida tropicalis MYA-3404]EER30540.1 predicted protein [Candida tropicalis MYA-3404]KAG4406404.1 hypothetical protein JTP64_003788 [Candida tropicalis]